MIRLTSHENGSHFYVNPEQIRAINFKDGATQVWMGTISASATESPQEVARKVLEWRLAMERYRAGIFAEARLTGEEAKMLAWARDVEYRIMLNLAGLEEPNHE